MTQALRKTKGKHPLFNTYIGKRAHLLRISHGDSQQAAGKHIEVTFQQFQKFEHGINQLGHYHAYRLSREYNVPIGYFSAGYEEYERTGVFIPDLVVPVETASEQEPEAIRSALEVGALYLKLNNSEKQKSVLNLLKALVEDQGGANGE